MKRFLLPFLMLILCTSIFLGCQPANEEQEAETETNSDVEINHEEWDGDNPVVTMTMENGGEVIIELYPNIAPNTVNNFISLIEDGFYDGLIFHRVIPGFMIQGGDPEGTGMGGPGYGIPGEFSANGFDNDLIHERGVLSMARTPDPDSAGSQFFIMTDPSPHLDGEYAGFGQVVEGMEVVDEIVQSETDGEKPVEDQVIDSMTVDLKGYPAQEPVTQ